MSIFHIPYFLYYTKTQKRVTLVSDWRGARYHFGLVPVFLGLLFGTPELK